jgi:ketosteroid isomerase-like protein
MTDAVALAKRFFDAIESGDVETVADCYAEDAVIWHNTDGLETTKADNLKVLGLFVKHLPGRRYEERRLSATADGFVQQHRLTRPRADGTTAAVTACIVCQVKDGRITRLDEYFDQAAIDAFPKG